MPSRRKKKTINAKDDPEADTGINFKLIKMNSGNRIGSRNGHGDNGNVRRVKVSVQLMPETRLLLALANEEVEARRKAGQSEAKIWRDCQKAPLTFVKRGFKRLLSA